MVIRHQRPREGEGEGNRKPINVFVTGFGPFPTRSGSQYTQNTSHLITRLLPSSLPAHTASNPSNRPITIHNPTAADGAYVRTEYAYIRSYIADLHERHAQDIDLFVHVGMANGWDFVSVERRAFRQGFSSDWWGGGSSAGSRKEVKAYYTMPDNSGQTVQDAGACPWEDVPLGLGTEVDVDGVVEGANERLESLDRGEETQEEEEGKGRGKKVVVKPHHEAGSYCCGFLYYESLANRWVKGTRGQVMFCHVPGETDKKSLEGARDAIVAIIASAAELLVKEKMAIGESEPV